MDSVWSVGWPGSWVRGVNWKYKSETHECVAGIGLMSLTELPGWTCGPEEQRPEAGFLGQVRERSNSDKVESRVGA